MLCDDVEPKKKDSFPGKDTANKNHGLFVYESPPNFLFPSIKVFSFPCCERDLHPAQQTCRP